GGRRVRMIEPAKAPRLLPAAGVLPIHADADFCITGDVLPGKLLPEGPFGDHLGYYSLAHDFPVLRVEHVYHRHDAIWPFTVILGQVQMSLAKYLWIAAENDDPALNVRDIPAFFAHVLRRVDWQRDLHFQTCTTIDTLDYSGSGLNEGSKVVIAAVGPPRRELPTEIPSALNLPQGYSAPRVAMPGVLVVVGPRFARDTAGVDQTIQMFAGSFSAA